MSVSQFIKVPKTSSYEIDDSTYLVDFLSSEIQQVNDFSDLETSEDSSEQILELEPVSCIDGDVLAHLTGFLLKPVVSAVNKCPTCTQILLLEPSEEHRLTQLKEYVPNGTNLLYANKEMLFYFSVREHIQAFF